MPQPDHIPSAAQGHDAACQVHNANPPWACTCGRDLAEARREIQRLRRVAAKFGKRVLNGDRYGCENGPGVCLHMDAKRFLDKIKVEA